MDRSFSMGVRALLPARPCMKLHELLHWMAIAGQLKRLHQREISSAGSPEPYAPLGMFKLMLLGQWHGLSGAQLEHTLTVGYTLADTTALEGGWSRFGYEGRSQIRSATPVVETVRLSFSEW